MDTNNMVQQKQPARPSGSGAGASMAQPNPPSEKLVKFVYPAPGARRVSVAGTFNNWTAGAFTLQKDPSGTWRGSLRLKTGTYQFRFYVDGKWASDPSAKKTVPNEFGGKNTVLEII